MKTDYSKESADNLLYMLRQMVPDMLKRNSHDGNPENFAELFQTLDEKLSACEMLPLAWLPPEAYPGGTAGTKSR